MDMQKDVRAIALYLAVHSELINKGNEIIPYTQTCGISSCTLPWAQMWGKGRKEKICPLLNSRPPEITVLEERAF